MHEEYTALMSTVLDHEAPPGDIARLSEHLADCADCTATWAHWRSLDAFLTGAPILMPAQGFVLQVAARLEAGRQDVRWRRWLGSGLLLLWGFIILALWAAVVLVAAWALTHSSAAALWISSGARLVSGLAASARALQMLLFDLGGLWLSLGVGFYLGLTALVLLAWAWLVARNSAWVRPLLAAGRQAES